MQSLKAKLWNWVFSYLTKPVKIEQVIEVNKIGQVKIDGRIISPAEIIELQQEVRAFGTMRLKTVLLNTPKSLAEQQMFANSKNWDDMLAGKLTLYTINIQENILTGILNAPQQNQIVMQKNPYQK